MRRILFFPEAASLAHIGRPIRLAETLDPEQWEVRFACADRYRTCFNGRKWPIETIESVDPAVFLRRLEKGTPLFSFAELEAYVEEDLAVLNRLKPDVVVGDLRLSLAVSARLLNIPYASICNAHWSPWADIADVPAPDISMMNALGVRIGNQLFRLGLPIALRVHAQPINRLRRKYGMKPYPDIRWAYTDSDTSLYADSEALVPTRGAPESHRYVGPLIWSTSGALPDWWGRVPSGPTAYVTLGSTGRADLLPLVLDVLDAQGFVSLVATAGRAGVQCGHRRFVEHFLPGEIAAARADVVVCNGGSATVYQALAQGRPVIGLYGNLDQALTMLHVGRAGAGFGVRAGTLERQVLTSAIECAVSSAFCAAAASVQKDFDGYDTGARFNAALVSLLR